MSGWAAQGTEAGLVSYGGASRDSRIWQYVKRRFIRRPLSPAMEFSPKAVSLAGERGQGTSGSLVMTGWKPLPRDQGANVAGGLATFKWIPCASSVNPHCTCCNVASRMPRIVVF